MLGMVLDGDGDKDGNGEGIHPLQLHCRLEGQIWYLAGSKYQTVFWLNREVSVGIRDGQGWKPGKKDWI